MTRHLLLATAAVALLATPAAAQNNPGASNSGQTASSGERSARDVTCRELTALDTATVPGVLYFISGYREGERNSAMTGQQSSDSSGGGSSMNQSADASGSASGSGSGSGGSTTMNQDATGATASGSSGSGSQTGNTTTGSGSADMAANSGSGAAATTGGTGTGGTAQISALRGYFDIPVEQTMVACRSAPDQRASDVLDQQRSGGGSGSGQTNSAQ